MTKKKQPRTIHAAIIDVSVETLLKMLDFRGGTLLDIRTDFECWHNDLVQCKIEHPDLPEVPLGECLQRISPTYRVGSGGAPERIDPPKLEAVDE